MKTIELKGLDEKIYKHTTKEGLDVYVWQNKNLKSTYMSLSVKYGSNHTKFKVGNKTYEVPKGIAHFLEHVKFNIDKDTTAHDLFLKSGGEANAYTTFLFTSYIVFATDKIIENLNILLDYVYTNYFTKQLINKEKGIIVEESNMGVDNPYNYLFYNHLKYILKSSNYRYEITGLEDDINSITLEDIELVYNTFYHPKNMFLIVCGNVNPYEIAKNVDDKLSEINFSEYQNPKIIVPKESKKVVKNYIELEHNVTNSKLRYALKIPRNKFSNFTELELRIYLNLLLQINFGSTSKLNEELEQNGLVFYMSYMYYLMDDYVIIFIIADTLYSEEVIKRIANQFDNLSVNESDFLRKQHAELANLILLYDNVLSVNDSIINDIIYFDEILDNEKEIYENLSYDKICELVNLIDKSECSICVLNPKKKQD